MLKTIAAGTIALTIAGTGLALAQQAPARNAQRWQPSAEDIAAFTDARIAAFKTGLKLTPEQEKNWPAVETAIRDLAKVRADRRKERHDRMAARRSGDRTEARPDVLARMRSGADALSQRAASLKRFADAAEPLYKSLNDDQKHRFGVMLRVAARRHVAAGHWRHEHRAENAR